MKIWYLKNSALTAIIVLSIVTISFSLFSEPIFAQMTPYMTPHHQMKMMNDPTQVTCRDGMVLMMKDSSGNPTCVNPSTYWKLADRDWGNFDTELLAQNQSHMQGVMGAMINHPQMSQNMHDWMRGNPQHM